MLNLRDIYEETNRLLAYAKQEQCNLNILATEIYNIQQRIQMNDPSADSDDFVFLTREEQLERGKLISDILLNQIKLEYIFELYTNDSPEEFGDFIRRKLSDIEDDVQSLKQE